MQKKYYLLVFHLAVLCILANVSRQDSPPYWNLKNLTDDNFKLYYVLHAKNGTSFLLINTII